MCRHFDPDAAASVRIVIRLAKNILDKGQEIVSGGGVNLSAAKWHAAIVVQHVV
jgi:hypothetical protein